MNVDFKVKDLGNKKLLVLSENRQIKTENGIFSDYFKPFESHVYTTDISLTGLKTVSEIKELIKKKSAQDTRKGIWSTILKRLN